MGRHIEIKSDQGPRCNFAPRPSSDQIYSRLVSKLGIKALRIGRAYEFVDEFVGLFGKRSRADHARCYRKDVKLSAGLNGCACGCIKPSRVRPILGWRIDKRQITRCVHVLAEDVAMANHTFFGKPRKPASDARDPARRRLPGRYPEQSDSIRVIGVTTEEDFVLEDEAQLTRRECLFSKCA